VRAGLRTTLIPLLLALAIAVSALSPASADAPAFVTKWGGHGASAGRFNHPEAIGVDRAGHVYVTDIRNRVQKFTSDGRFLLQWGSSGKGRGQFSVPTGVASDQSGHVYVVDGDNNRVEKFTAQGGFVRQWRILGTGPGKRPGGVATDRAGNVYVGADDFIEKFSPSGKLLAKWGGFGYGAGQIRHANGIAIDEAGNVYVTDGPRVSKFTSRGLFLLAWGKGVGGPGVDVCTTVCGPATPGAEGGLHSVGGIAVAPNGDVFVVDERQARVLRFSSEGAYLEAFGRFGTGRGQFRSPHALAADRRGNLYVADTSNDRIQKFR
jgi:tripartite motif-containing protein 71